MSTKCPICNTEINDSCDVCPACGFKFTSNTQKFEPIVAKQVDNSKRPVREPSLRVIKGPQGEIVLPLSKERMTIGRSPKSDIFLNDRTVSREHAIVLNNSGKYQIVDSNSFNGVWINNNNITTANLNNGDVIQIGAFFLRFEE